MIDEPREIFKLLAILAMPYDTEGITTTWFGSVQWINFENSERNFSVGLKKSSIETSSGRLFNAIPAFPAFSTRVISGDMYAQLR